MRCLLLLALLPFLWAAEIEVKRKIVCPDGSECLFGKTCNPLPSGAYQCVDLPGEKLLDKKLTPALQSAFVNQSISLSPSVMKSWWCEGTECDDGNCCEFKNAECCSDKVICCASFAHCCSNKNNPLSWCCLNGQRCDSDYGYCRSAAALAKASLVYFLCAFLFGMVSKYLF